MENVWLDSENIYDGSQLRSHFCYMTKGVIGNSVISWCGPCDVNFEHMIDGEDLLAKNVIQADRMLHFIVEMFDVNLFAAACFQRIMSAILADMVQKRLVELNRGDIVERRGDDVYVAGGKMNVSVASRSTISSMIHFGVNVDNLGTPVKTYAISDLNWPLQDFKDGFAEKVRVEFEQIQRATQKVFPLN